MIIYNVTKQVSWTVHEEWLEWLRTEHLPQMEVSELFDFCQVVKLLELDDVAGPTYAIQYYASFSSEADDYRRRLLADTRTQETGRWGEMVYSFSTMMEVIN